MKSHLSEMCRAVKNYVGRKRKETLKRRTKGNDMWQISECPNFLDPERLRAPLPSAEGGGYLFEGAIKFFCVDGDVWVFPDGRVIDLRPRA